MASKLTVKLSVLLCMLAIGIIFSCRQAVDPPRQSGNRSEAVDGALAHVMLDLSEANNPEKEWCYSPKSTTVIGVPFMPRPVQVSFDGALYTGDAELCFFYGDPLKPVYLLYLSDKITLKLVRA